MKGTPINGASPDWAARLLDLALAHPRAVALIAIPVCAGIGAGLAALIGVKWALWTPLVVFVTVLPWCSDG